MAISSAAVKDLAAASSFSPAPRHAADDFCSPKSRRSSRTSSSPWNQILRPESESFCALSSSSSVISSPRAVVESLVSSPASSSSPSTMEEPMGGSLEDCNELNRNAEKKTVWNKPSTGAADVGQVMGAISWPALSESTRASPKSSESLKSLSYGSSGSELQKQIGSNVNADSSWNPNQSLPARQKSIKRNSANNLYSVGTSQQAAYPGSSVDSLPNYLKDHNQRSPVATQSPTGNDYPPQHRTSSRNRNGGMHLRGDSSHHHNHWVRRDYDRGNQDWNGHRNFSGHQQRVVPRHLRPSPPPTTVPFIPPSSVRPYGGQMPFPELAPSVIYVADPYRGVPFVAPMPHPAMFFPAPDLHLFSKIVNQIDYYFSNENLVKDMYLRRNMDDQGWVPIKLIAGFNKVLYLTDNLLIILDALRTSTVVEVQGDKVRRRNDWMRWTMPSSDQTPNIPGLQSHEVSSNDLLAPGVKNLSLENKSN